MNRMNRRQFLQGLGLGTAAVTLPIFVIATTPYDPVIWVSVAVIGALAIWRHWPNIVRLKNHTENKIDCAVVGKKK